MTEKRKVVRVFLASPGDLQEERRGVKNVVDEINALWGAEYGYQIELVGWEDTIPGYGRPQALINQDLSRCELFVGMMWKRWGTPPDAVGGRFTSGFEEEFETSLANRERVGAPELNMLFKDVPADLESDPGEDLRKVLNFKAKLIASKKILFDTFSDAKDLEGRVRRYLTRYIQTLKTREEPIAEDTRALGGAVPAVQKSAERPGKSPLSAEGAAFLRAFADKSEGDLDTQPITPAEIARVRLLSSLVATTTNDRTTLGAHDANIIYAQRDAWHLGEAEVRGLIQAGLEHFSSENTPIWHWYLSANKGKDRPSLARFSVSSATANQRAGALAAMRLTKAKVPLISGLEREFFVSSWLSDDAIDVRVAALSYLAAWGRPVDVAQIQKEVDRGGYQTRSVAIEAIVRIRLREGVGVAAQALAELQPDSVDLRIVKSLFESGFPNELLSNAATHRCAAIRCAALQRMATVGLLNRELAVRLTSDSDPDVRYAALMWLARDGQPFSREEAKEILVKPTRGLGLSSIPDERGQHNLQRFREDQMRSMTDAELEGVISQQSIFDQTAEFILFDRYFSTRGDQLRGRVDDLFKADFEAKIADMRRHFGVDGADLVEKIRAMEDSIRQRLTRQGLDVICRHKDPRDLQLVRRALSSGYVNYAPIDLEYLKIGEWNDIELLISLSEKVGNMRAASLLTTPKERLYGNLVGTLRSIAGPETQRLLEQQMPPALRTLLILNLPETEFQVLPDAVLLSLFGYEDDEVRKATSLQCVRYFAKARLHRLIDAYISQDGTRYYNVVHWLDMGASISSQIGRPAAELAMEDMRLIS